MQLVGASSHVTTPVSASFVQLGLSHSCVHAPTGSQCSSQPVRSQAGGPGSAHVDEQDGGAQSASKPEPSVRAVHVQLAGAHVGVQLGFGAWQWLTRLPPEAATNVGARQFITQCGCLHCVVHAAHGSFVQTGQWVSHSGFSHFATHSPTGSWRTQAAVG